MSDVMGSKSILSDRLKGVRRSVLSARFLTNCYHDEYGELLPDDQARYIGKIKARLDYASWALGEEIPTNLTGRQSSTSPSEHIIDIMINSRKFKKEWSPKGLFNELVSRGIYESWQHQNCREIVISLFKKGRIERVRRGVYKLAEESSDE